MKVLLSIKPEYADKIFSGSKKYEYRKIIFRRPNITKILVYATCPVGKLIGEFEIEKILEDTPEEIWNTTKRYSGISEEKYFEYFLNKETSYAIKIKKINLYSNPISLKKRLGVLPPQSFVYLK